MVKSIKIGSSEGTITIGRRGENLATTVIFDCGELIDKYGVGIAVLMVKRPGDDQAYPAVTTQDGAMVTWNVTSLDTEKEGRGKAELFWYVGSVLAKTIVYTINIKTDIGEAASEPPDPYESWVDTLVDLGVETSQNAQDAAQSASDAQAAQIAAETAQTAADVAQAKAESAADEAVTAKTEDIGILYNRLFSTEYEPSNITKIDGAIYLEMGYIAADTGKGGTSSTGKYYRSQVGNAGSGTFLQIGSQAIIVSIGLDWVQCSCWSYSSGVYSSATHSNTGNAYVSGSKIIYIPHNDEDTRFTLSLRKTDQTVFSSEELVILKNAIKFYRATDTTLTVNGSAADAKAAGDAVTALREDVLTKYNGSSPESVMDLPDNVFWVANGDTMQEKLGEGFSWTLPPNTTHIIRKIKTTTSSRRYELSTLGGRTKYTGYTISSSTDITWIYDQSEIESKMEKALRHVRLLAFGSSFTYSTLGLVPAVVKEIAPEIDLTLGILYISGGGIEDHIDKITNIATYTKYSEYRSSAGKWTNYTDSVTAQAALAKYVWDYIAVQPRAAEWDGPGRDTPGAGLDTLETLENLILGIVDYPFCLLYNIPQSNGKNDTFSSKYTQPTGREKSDAMFADIAHFAEEAWKKKFVWDVLPGGTAAQNARHTVLTDIGVKEDLCYDMSSHLQNGIGTLVPAYAVAGKIMALSGFPVKVLGVQLSPTDTWLANDYNLYTASLHGACVGVTVDNKRIAQKCAISALKKPFEISELEE